MEFGLLTLGDHLPDPATGEYARTGAGRHRAVVESAVVAEQAGFSSVWIGEHHFCDYIVSCPPVLLAAIAERTSHLRLGTGVTLLANLDPVRAAEDYATVDCLSGGRVEMVAGRGILAETYDAFGQPIAESRDRFRENVELLLRLWSEEDVDWSGRFRAPLSGVTVQPRPVQQPHPPIWIAGGSSEVSVDLAADLGLDLMLPSVLAPPEIFAPFVERYRARWKEAGHAGAPRVGCCSHVHVRPDSQDARDFFRPHYSSYLGFVEGLWVRRDLVNADPNAKIDRDAVFEKVAVCGSPAEVAERIAHSRDALDLDVYLAMFDLGGMPEPEVAAAIELFGAEVIPRV